MEFLKELMSMTSDKPLNEAKKDKPAKSGPLKLLPLKPFSAGNMVMSHRSDEDEDPPVEESDSKMKTPKVPKPRNQHVNDVLMSRKGGRMYDAKRDYVRAKVKQEERRNSDE